MWLPTSVLKSSIPGPSRQLGHPRRNSRPAGIASVLALVLAACSESVPDEPVVAGVDLPDKELAAFLRESIKQVRVTPDSSVIRGRLGMAYEVNGFPKAALATYRQAESLDPEDFRWPYFAALLLARKGDHEGALNSLRRAIELDADYAPAWLWRGTWLLERRRLEESSSAFRRAGELGADLESRFGEARVLMSSGRYAEAVEALEPLARESNHPSVHRALGQSLRAVGDLDMAREAVARGRDARPFEWADERQTQKAPYTRGYASFAAAQELSGLGRIDEALAIFERLRSYYPDEQCGAESDYFFTCNLINSLSIAYGRAGRLETAMGVVDRGLAINPDFAPFHLTIADHHRQQRDIETALRHVERAIELNPMLGHAHAQRGRFLSGLQRHEEARTALLAALHYEPEKRTTLFYLGMVEAELQNWTEAAERFAGTVRVDPEFALGHLYLAKSLGEDRRIAEAHRALETAERLAVDRVELRMTTRRLRELESAAATHPRKQTND